MTYDSAAYRAHAREMASSDRYPVCPACGNLCGVLARICADCGARLHPTEADLRLARESGKMPAMPSADDATEATRETGQ